jgi:glucose/arabinose dehydrogenase
MPWIVPLLVVALTLLSGSQAVGAPTGSIALVEVASGFDRPVAVVTHPSEPGTVLVVEQPGLVSVVRDGVPLDTPALDVTDRVLVGVEQGLFDLVFHPDFVRTRMVIISSTDRAGDLVVARHTMDDDLAIAAEPDAIILRVEQSHQFHQGGGLAFGPDGHLYIGVGDGGWPDNVFGTGQDVTDLFGSIVRLDLDAATDAEPYAIPADNPFVTAADGARPEIWLYGLRNPWRISFDEATGDLYIADVGHLEREEINLHRAGDPAGLNYGWNILEGTRCFRGDDCDRAGMTPPFIEYPGQAGGVGDCAVTGGLVYRGDAVRVLHSSYVYGDWCSGRVWSYRLGIGPLDPVLKAHTDLLITSFATDAAGRLYVTDYRGALYEIVDR